jgi:hypothetical protein
VSRRGQTITLPGHGRRSFLAGQVCLRPFPVSASQSRQFEAYWSGEILFTCCVKGVGTNSLCKPLSLPSLCSVVAICCGLWINSCRSMVSPILGSWGGEFETLLNLLRQGRPRFLFPVDHDHPRFAGSNRAEPSQQIRLSRVRTEPAEGVDLGLHGNLLAVNADQLLAGLRMNCCLLLDRGRAPAGRRPRRPVVLQHRQTTWQWTPAAAVPSGARRDGARPATLWPDG